MSQSKVSKVEPGDWVFVVNKKSGVVVRGHRLKYVGETEKFFLVEVPVVLLQGVDWVVCSFDKEGWGLVKEPEKCRELKE
jgi:hypothetical protein